MVVVRLFFSGDQAHKSKKMSIKISIFWTSTQNNIFFFFFAWSICRIGGIHHFTCKGVGFPSISSNWSA